MTELFGNRWQVIVDKQTKLVAGLIEMQNHKRFRICLSDLPNILIP
jgi:hypothetical protein